MHWSCQISSLLCQLQACSATANSMHFIAKCEFKIKINTKIKVHAFSCEGYSRVEVLFPHTVNLTSAMVQDMLHTMGLEIRRLNNATNCDRHRTSAMNLFFA